MKSVSRKPQGLAVVVVVLSLFLLVRPDAAQAYLGPGAGLGMVGTLISVIVAIGVAILGVLLYPIRLYRKLRKKKKDAGGAAQ